jgi:hypothetical protein
MKVKKFLDKIHLPVWLLILLSFVLILRIPSLFEPYYYGDEMISLAVGEAIKKGVILYKGIHDNKPPLLYLISAFAGNLFWLKAILAFWNIGSIILFWRLAETLFPKKEKLHKIATSAFAILTTIPLLEGNTVNGEILMIGPSIAAFLLLFSAKHTFRNLFWAGILFSIAILIKVPAIFEVPVLIIFWLIQSDLKKGNLKDIFLKILYLLAGLLLPILLTLLYFWLKGALQDYLKAAFLQNIGYLSTFRPGDVQKAFLLRNLPLIIRGVIVAGGIILLVILRKRLSSQFIFATTWLLFALFAATLSERPYPHYLIQAVPAISFLLAILFSEKTLEQTLVILPLTLAFFVPIYYKFYYYSTSSYYLRFFKFAIHLIDKNKYFAEFEKTVNRNYEIANFLVKSSRPDERIFVNGDTPAIYALTRRLPAGKYLADYHISDFSSRETEAKILQEQKPSFIILLPEARPFAQVFPVLRNSYILISNIDGAEIWKSIKK